MPGLIGLDEGASWVVAASDVGDHSCCCRVWVSANCAVVVSYRWEGRVEKEVSGDWAKAAKRIDGDRDQNHEAIEEGLDDEFAGDLDAV